MSSTQARLSMIRAARNDSLHDDSTLFARHTGGGNPPGGSDLERRVQELEKSIPDIRERLACIETKLDSIENHSASKADIEAMGARIEATARSIIQWSVGSALVLAGLVFAAARFISTGSPT